MSNSPSSSSGLGSADSSAPAGLSGLRSAESVGCGMGDSSAPRSRFMNRAGKRRLDAASPVRYWGAGSQYPMIEVRMGR